MFSKLFKAFILGKENIARKQIRLKNKLRVLKKQRGFSALELTLVLGVIGIATIAILREMSGNGDKVNAQNMITDVTSLVQNIRSDFSSSSDGYNNLTTSLS